MCKGSIVSEGLGKYSCEYCGMKFTEEAIRIKIGGSVSIDRTPELNNLLIRTCQFFDSGDFFQSNKYCERVLDMVANNYNAINLQGLIESKEREYVEKCIKNHEIMKSGGCTKCVNSKVMVKKYDGCPEYYTCEKCNYSVDYIISLPTCYRYKQYSTHLT